MSDNPRATLANVAEEAGVSRATLHRYFTSRDELIRMLALESIDAIDRACGEIDYYGQSASESLRQTLDAIVPLGAHYSFLALQGEAVAHDPEVARNLKRQLSQTAELVEAAKAEGTFGADVPTAWIVATIDALIYASWSTVHQGTVAPRDVAKLMFRTLTSGLGPRRAGAKVGPKP